MKFILAILASVLFVTTSVIADTDVKSEGSVEKSTSVNPLTGTKTTKKKYKKAHKNGNSQSNDTVTEKTKVYNDGTTSTEKEEKSSEENK